MIQGAKNRVAPVFQRSNGTLAQSELPLATASTWQNAGAAAAASFARVPVVSILRREGEESLLESCVQSLGSSLHHAFPRTLQAFDDSSATDTAGLVVVLTARAVFVDSSYGLQLSDDLDGVLNHQLVFGQLIQ